MVKENVAKIKTKAFALRIVKLYKFLREQNEFVLSKQVLRSGTSIGANVAESECAQSENDFIAKIYIALKESAETQYWLELLKDAEYIDEKSYRSIYKDCNEITKILNATTKTIKMKK